MFCATRHPGRSNLNSVNGVALVPHFGQFGRSEADNFRHSLTRLGRKTLKIGEKPRNQRQADGKYLVELVVLKQCHVIEPAVVKGESKTVFVLIATLALLP